HGNSTTSSTSESTNAIENADQIIEQSAAAGSHNSELDTLPPANEIKAYTSISGRPRRTPGPQERRTNELPATEPLSEPEGVH
ncbi:MAG: hypothetical protein IAF58_07035, partial [Leptolyngbya sp.]|nr:hypothetical protein [Candidatus Melainabacteria bacterium]